MIKLFTLRQPIVFLLLVLLVFLLKLPSFLLPVKLTGDIAAYTFFGELFDFLNQTKFISYIGGCSIVVLQTLHLSYIFEKHGVHYKSTYLPSLAYVIGTSLFNGMDVNITPVLLAQTPIMLTLELYFDLYKSGTIREKIFIAMFVLGIGILLYLPLAFLIPVFWICLFFVKIPSVRDFMVATTGALLPVYFIFVFFYYTGEMEIFLTKMQGIFQFTTHIHFEESKPELVLLVIIGIIILITSFKLYTNHFKNIIKTRIIQQMLFVLSFITLFLLIFLLQFQYQHLLLFGIPFSYLLSYFFLGKWRFLLDEIIAIGLLSFILILRFNNL